MRKFKYLIVLLFIILVPVLASAATNDFTANGNITVSSVSFGSGTADMLIFSGSTAASWLFNGGVFTVTDPGSAFHVGSSDSSVKSIQISQSGSTLVCAENTTPGTSYAALPTASGTYTVAPSSTVDCTDLCTPLPNAASYNSYPTCGAATCNDGFKVIGSGADATCAPVGGGGVFKGKVPNLPEPRLQRISPDGTIVYLDEEESAPAKEVPVVENKTPAIAGGFVFTVSLGEGMKSADVKKLQEMLASDPSIYPEGIVSGFFGRLTKKAVQRFQEKYGIVSGGTPDTTGYGYVGPKTRAKLNEVFGGGNNLSAGPTVKSPAEIMTGAPFTSPLFKGMSDPKVKLLQQLLNSRAETKLASVGVGSPGNETNYFGSLTEKAVQRFQEEYNIAGPGDPGYGYVGPKTRAKLNELLSG